MDLNLKHKWECVRMRTHLISRFLIIAIMLMTIGISKSSAATLWQDQMVKIRANKTPLKEVLLDIREQSGIDFLFKEEQIKSVKINLKTEDRVSEVLKICLEGTGLMYNILDNIIVIKPSLVDQDNSIDIKGRVIDEKGVPMPGVNVVVQGSLLGATTDSNGKFTIKVKINDALRFSFIGYKTQLVLIEKTSDLEVQLKPEVGNIEEVSVVAFGEQKKESVVSAITSVRVGSLKSSSSDLTTSFAGNIPGLIGWQTGGLPGAMTEEEMNTRFYIRGITSFQTKSNIDPLILLDGVEVSKLDLARVNPDDIESFNVMKDASATAMYGARGANGVIYVTTKKGEAGDVYVSANFERIYSMPTREIDVVDPITWMRKYNEAAIGNGGNAKYTSEYINKTANGKFPSYVYPANDWYQQLFKSHSVNNHYNLSARGGGNKVQYYASLTHNRDNGMIKVDKLNDFDPNIQSNQTNFLSNLSIDLTKTSQFLLNSIINYDVYTGPHKVNTKQIYALAFSANPVDFAAVYPADDFHVWPHIRFGGNGVDVNPYAAVQKGYTDRKRYSAIVKAEYIQKLDKYIKGLEMRTSVAINQTGYYVSAYTTVPAFYSLPEQNYNHTTGKHNLIPLNLEAASRIISSDANNSFNESSTSVDYQLRLLHVAAWDDHQTSFTLVGQLREEDESTLGSYLSTLPQRNVTLSARATYGYKDKYFAELSAGLNGSERFAKEHKFGLFPAVGLGWIASKENFMKGINWLNFLKLRLTYGRTGNDGVYQESPRFLHLINIGHLTGGINLSNSISGNSDYFRINSYADPTITWEISEMVNAGVDFKLCKGLFDVTADIYQEIRHNIFDVKTTVPATMGLYQRPMGNVGKVKSRGIDLSAKVQHAFSSDFWMILNGTFTYNKASFLELDEPSEKEPYQMREGSEISQKIGYVSEGLFQDWKQIESSPFQGGDVRPGDIRYRDINQDGVISIKDAVPIGFPETPRLVYGFNGFVHYKGFEMNFAFQGSGKNSFWIDPKQVSPFDGNRALLTAIANDHWTSENGAHNPLWPRLSTKNIIEHNPQENYANAQNYEERRSTYFMKNGSFLRCTRLELGYYLKKQWIEKYKLRSFKLFARTNNPFLISDFDLWDIELKGNGFNYPIQKTYSLGLNLSF